jgi:LysM repeat protein
VTVALVALLAGASVFGGAARQTVVSGPTDTAVVITFTPAEMAGAARAGAGASTTAGSITTTATTTTIGGPTTTTTFATVDTGMQIAAPTSTKAPPKSSTTRSTAAASGGEYVVKAGDTPASIAEMLGVSTAELMRVNGITDPTNLLVGAVLEVPSP